MALQGTLDTFSLTDVLALLASTAKSGRLWVDDNHRSGSVFLVDGTIVAAGMDDHLDQEPVAVVFELLRSVDGAFLFEADIPSPFVGPGATVADVLEQARALRQEWDEVTAVVPSQHRLVTLVAELPGDEVRIDAATWRVIVAIAGGRTVAELGAALGLTELEAGRTVKHSIEAGLVALGDVDVDAELEAYEADEVDEPDEVDEGYEDGDDAGALDELDDEPFDEPADEVEPELVVADDELATEAVDVVDDTPATADVGAWDVAPAAPAGDWSFASRTTADDADRAFATALGLDADEAVAAAAEPSAWAGWDPLAPSPSGLEEAWAAETPTSPLLSFGSPLPPPASLAEALGGQGDAGAELGELTPQAARALAAAAQAETEAERDAALAEATDHNDEPLDRGLLLRFLSSVKQ